MSVSAFGYKLYRQVAYGYFLFLDSIVGYYTRFVILKHRFESDSRIYFIKFY